MLSVILSKKAIIRLRGACSQFAPRFSTRAAASAARTPEERFDNLVDYPFEPNFINIDVGNGTSASFRLHYLDEGPKDGEVILCLHGQPTWSYLYRKMIPVLTKAGYRVIAPDLIGFGKSDKPTDRAMLTYSNHVYWLECFVKSMKLREVTMVAQDWGGLLGLRVLAQNADVFARVVVANTGLPDNEAGTSRLLAAPMRLYYRLLPALPIEQVFHRIKANKFRLGFLYWIKHCDKYPDLRVGDIVYGSLPSHFKARHESEDAKALRRAYDAPFPSEDFMQAVRQFPTLVPIFPDDPEIEKNRQAWKVLEAFDKPLLTCFTDNDPVTRGAHKRFQRSVPGAAHQNHVSLKGGHFLQEEIPLEFSEKIIDFCKNNPILADV